MSSKKYKHFLFNEDRDRDILDWLNSLENQSNEVRKAIRMYMAHQGNTIPTEISLADVLDEINNLSHKIDNIKIIESNEVVEKEMPDLVAKLKTFGV